MQTAKRFIRPARIDDCEQILAFIQELARYEQAEDEVVASVPDIRQSLFGTHANVHALLIEDQGHPVGFAIYFLNFSTWLGRHGLFLEDLYIMPTARRRGHATALLRHLARMAVEQGYGRLEWNVLRWNESARALYESLGASPQHDWIGYRLAGQALQAFAAGSA